MQYDGNAWERLGHTFTNNYEMGVTDFRRNIIDTVLMHKGECRHLLDIACADGWFIEQLRSGGFEKAYLGVDITPNLIARARERMPFEEFALNDAMNLAGVERQQFDFVLCVGVLMHLPDYQKAISEACRVANRYVMFSTYGTYGPTYGGHDAQNQFLNYFYNINDILNNVPDSFQLVEFKSFDRGRMDHMFQFLYKRA